MPRWPYGNPKSITGLLRFIDEDGWKTEVVCKDDSDKEKNDCTTLDHLLSDILEIYGVDKLDVKITVEILNPPCKEPKFYLNDDAMMEKLSKDLDDIKKTGKFILIEYPAACCGVHRRNLTLWEKVKEEIF